MPDGFEQSLTIRMCGWPGNEAEGMVCGCTGAPLLSTSACNYCRSGCGVRSADRRKAGGTENQSRRGLPAPFLQFLRSVASLALHGAPRSVLMHHRQPPCKSYIWRRQWTPRAVISRLAHHSIMTACSGSVRRRPADARANAELCAPGLAASGGHPTARPEFTPSTPYTFREMFQVQGASLLSTSFRLLVPDLSR